MRMVFFSLLASSFFRKCVRVTNVEAHAAHYRMANIILNSSPRQHRRGERATHTERRRKVSSRPGKEAQSGPGATTLLRARPVDSSRVIPASEFVSSGRRFLGMRSPWRRGVPAAVRRTQTRGVRDCVIDRARGSTTTSSWSTRSPAPLSGCRSATRWKAELPSTPTGTFERAFVIREGRPSRCYGIGVVSQQSDTARRDVCRPTSGGPHTTRVGSSFQI